MGGGGGGPRPPGAVVRARARVGGGGRAVCELDLWKMWLSVGKRGSSGGASPAGVCGPPCSLPESEMDVRALGWQASALERVAVLLLSCGCGVCEVGVDGLVYTALPRREGTLLWVLLLLLHVHDATCASKREVRCCSLDSSIETRSDKGSVMAMRRCAVEACVQ